MDFHSHPSPPSLAFSFLLCPSDRDSFRIFQKLSEIFSDENNYSLSRELLIKVEWRQAETGAGTVGGGVHFLLEKFLSLVHKEGRGICLAPGRLRDRAPVNRTQ